MNFQKKSPITFDALRCPTKKCRLTRKLSTAGKEGLNVIFVKTVVPEHLVKLLQILNVTLERHLLLPATYK